MAVIHSKSSRLTFAALILLVAPILTAQTSRSLEWHLEQQPASVPCSSDDIAFVNAPEQVALKGVTTSCPTFPRRASVRSTSGNANR